MGKGKHHSLQDKFKGPRKEDTEAVGSATKAPPIVKFGLSEEVDLCD
ncbi:uncharacterized protein RSE6_02194 [Rhynchosporium secalis]|uniref:Uncharacterized protein n=1 Tax=Rhynchosporium secalis TaxID=38038 RepID=A0A1E1LZR8_RHYSE|nr:uncharacterized protein RSE6_02194 [Rhynchosporium secalis]